MLVVDSSSRALGYRQLALLNDYLNDLDDAFVLCHHTFRDSGGTFMGNAFHSATEPRPRQRYT